METTYISFKLLMKNSDLKTGSWPILYTLMLLYRNLTRFKSFKNLLSGCLTEISCRSHLEDADNLETWRSYSFSKPKTKESNVRRGF